MKAWQLDGLGGTLGFKDIAVPVVLTGDIPADASSLRAAANGGAQMAFDTVGGARDPNATLAGIRSLHRAGRLVLVGTMSTLLQCRLLVRHVCHFQRSSPGIICFQLFN